MTPACDVAVVGGGSAGIAAAVAAAECGAHTLLLERAPELGGNISQALVHTICGLYGDAEASAEFANPGFPRRFVAELRRVGAAGAPLRSGRVWVLPTEPPRVAAAAAALCRAVPNLEVRLATEVVAACLARDGDASQALRLRDATGAESEVAAGVIVDASGDATAAALGGADVASAPGGDLQIPSFIFRLVDVDTQALEELAGFERLRVTRSVAHAVREGALPPGCEALLVRPAATVGEVYVTLNVPRGGEYDPLDPRCMGALHAAAQGAARQILEFLRSDRPAFARSRVDLWPARLGVRETRRVCGRIEIGADDIRAGRRRPDEVAVSTWPIELWQDHRRARFEHPAGAASIPLGALISRSHPRLATAGRCLSADREALGALRVIGTALACGEAAGVAAGRAADAGVGLAEVAPEQVRAHILGRAGEKP